ncbi:hypothetical protein IW146_005012 [Coemansia sp. RSA 922]|nr:hypothetical protein H4S04_001055 [Coemansia sp. S16]KAJ2069773.1 hypothetical protein GGI08_000177 [Coemansia sp. S2]KAJ2111907.1 hypothetical protein IW146_005012 [Coemansia sp. RSA 922]KAJ2353827.1 hypothetical protein GGH92_000413 [Coemansia sp. RSA 2673]
MEDRYEHCFHCDYLPGQKSKDAIAFGSQDNDVIVGNPISRPMRVAGRCAYLFNATYKGKPAVLKLSWIRTNRLPEGAVYRALEGHHVPNIPVVYMSGVIIKNFDGYRLEFPVIKYCGVSVVDFIHGFQNNKTTKAKAAPEMTRYIRQVVLTLSATLAANVIHHNVLGGNAYIIDWAFDRDKVIKTEGLRNPFTGTFMYMSACLLLVAKESSTLELPSLVA